MFSYKKSNLPNAKRMRREMTMEERKLWLFCLKQYDLHIYAQRPIKNYIVDFYIPKIKLAIELDGSQHYDEGHTEEYDKIRTTELNKYGVEVVRITNLDINKNFKGVCEYIDNLLTERLGFSPKPKC